MTSAPAKRKSWAVKLPTRPPPTTSTVSPGWTLEERKAEMLTPAMRVKHEVLAGGFARDEQRHALCVCLDDGSVAGKGQDAVARLHAGDHVADF